MENFTSFIRNILSLRGKVNKKNVLLFTSDEDMKSFQTAFTHGSFDTKINGEIDEFSGDPVVNACVAGYIRKRFPDIKSVKWLTRVKHNFISKKYLGLWARRLGFEEYIRYGDFMKNIIEEKTKTGTLEYDIDYRSMFEDCFEAFIGCLTAIIDREKPIGVAYAISYNIISSLLEEERIDIKFDIVFDAISRLKEVYESKSHTWKWPHGEMKNPGDMNAYGVHEREDGTVEVTVYGWPLGDKEPTLKNRIILAKKQGVDKDEVKQLAADAALRELSLKYRILETPSNPYEYHDWKPPRRFDRVKEAAKSTVKSTTKKIFG